MTKSGLIKRIFEQEVDKLEGVKDELFEKGVSVDDYFTSLEETHDVIKESMLLAIEKFDDNKQEDLLKEARTFCAQTRKTIEELTLEHLNKGYK